MLEIDISDVIGILKLCIPYLIVLGVVIIIAIIASIIAKKLSRPKKYLVRRGSLLASLLTLAIVANLICFGPMSTIIGLATGSGTVTEDSAAEAMSLAEEIAGEGIVLLQNDSLLPLKDTPKLNVFGWGSINPVYGGSGSGSINDLWPIVNIEEGLTNAGFELNNELSKFYSDYSANRPKMSIQKQGWTLPEPPVDTYSDEMLQNAKNFSNTAVVVIARMGGEGYQDMPKDVSQGQYDNNSEKYEDFPAGEHYLQLSKSEKDMVELVCNNFENVVLIYNSAHAFELGFVENYKQIKSVLWCPGTGNVGFNSLGNILTGKINPSARTADTFIYEMENTPWWNTFSPAVYENMSDLAVEFYVTPEYKHTLNPSFINYNEGIYVGYKFYETAATEGLIDYDKVVQYPFGYGLSYTAFKQEMSAIIVADNKVSFDVTVTNTGQTAGKDVVEVYYNPPYANGGIEKSVANLVTFEKTNELAPGEAQVITISFALEDMASFDEFGKGSYVLEAGDYIISINSDSHTVLSSQTHTQASEIVYNDSNARSNDDVAATRQFDYAAGDITFLSRNNAFENYAIATTAPPSNSLADRYISGYITNKNFDSASLFNNDFPMPTTGASNGLKLVDLRGAAYEDERWNALLDQMTVEEMSSLTAVAGFQTAKIDSIGKLATVDCDGPASINNNFTGTGSVGFPVAVMIASTWNKDLALRFGESIGTMANEMGVSGWYAPAMNTHRTPFGGRNFEYYSEDGVLAGNIAANAVKGAKNKGLYAYIKHFAMYDSNAMMVSSWSNEQSMREIYFKPFEYAVKEGGANAVMVAWSFIGNRWCGASSNLLNTVLRDEWGFRGFVLTDSFGNDGRGFMNADVGLMNGVDAFLTNYDTEHNRLTDTTSTSAITALRTSSKNILYAVANSNKYEAGNLDAKIPTWKIVAIVIDIIIIVLLILAAILVYRKSRRLAELPDDIIVDK